MLPLPSLLCFLSRGINAAGLPPTSPVARSAWHPLRQHLLFMDDPEGLSALIQFYFGLLQLTPSLGRVFRSDGGFAHTPPFRTSLLLLPDNGRLQLDWRPDGRGLRRCRQLVEIDNGVKFNGEPLVAAQDDDGWSVAWPPELGLTARIAGAGAHDLLLTPRSFDLTAMLAQAPHRWLEQSSLQEDWVSSVWEWQKLAVLWLALHRLEGA